MDGMGKGLCAIYGVVAAVALIGTWTQNLTFLSSPDNGGMVGFLRAALSNPAAASLTIDLALVGVALCIWMVAESQRVGIRFVAVYIVLSLVIGISVVFPLFLIVRQLKLPQDQRLRLP